MISMIFGFNHSISKMLLLFLLFLKFYFEVLLSFFFLYTFCQCQKFQVKSVTRLAGRIIGRWGLLLANRPSRVAAEGRGSWSPSWRWWREILLAGRSPNRSGPWRLEDKRQRRQRKREQSRRDRKSQRTEKPTKKRGRQWG